VTCGSIENYVDATFPGCIADSNATATFTPFRECFVGFSAGVANLTCSDAADTPDSVSTDASAATAAPAVSAAAASVAASNTLFAAVFGLLQVAALLF
jgi:hypothetical protein